MNLKSIYKIFVLVISMFFVGWGHSKPWLLWCFRRRTHRGRMPSGCHLPGDHAELERVGQARDPNVGFFSGSFCTELSWHWHLVKSGGNHDRNIVDMFFLNLVIFCTNSSRKLAGSCRMLWSLMETFQNDMTPTCLIGLYLEFSLAFFLARLSWKTIGTLTHIDSHDSKSLHLRNFLYFCGSSNVVVVRWLLRYSASPFAHDSNNTTAVHASWHHSQIQKWKFMKMLEKQDSKYIKPINQ